MPQPLLQTAPRDISGPSPAFEGQVGARCFTYRGRCGLDRAACAKAASDFAAFDFADFDDTRVTVAPLSGLSLERLRYPVSAIWRR